MEEIPYPSPPPAHLPKHYGSYHQLYRLDGKLIAMSIIDICGHYGLYNLESSTNIRFPQCRHVCPASTSSTTMTGRGSLSERHVGALNAPKSILTRHYSLASFARPPWRTKSTTPVSHRCNPFISVGFPYRMVGLLYNISQTPSGFYVHSCQKMRYKGEYHPSYLADPVRPFLVRKRLSSTV